MIKDTTVRRWRRAVLTGGLLALSLVLGACGRKEKDQTSQIRKSGLLRVAVEQGHSGLTRMENGEYQGLEPDLAKQIANGFQIGIQFIPVEENRTALDYLDSGEADMAIGSIVDTGNLSTHYGITTPYAKGYLYAVTSRGNYTNSLAGFSDSIVGISPELSDQMKLSFSQIDSANQKKYDSQRDGWKDLENGDIQVYFCYEDEAVEMIKANEIFQAQNLTDAETEDYVIATAKANQGLLEGMEMVEEAYLDILAAGQTPVTE